ncbi:MAG: NADH-quinone oxidoreductase subunit C [Sulfolobales archaeon]|nr:NADH-quinone oxidoreductase subunit C [Sulfolobales archaeon]MDW7969757.1 NADH-quinone oxidoreductase subunit C [Sulfolobales archaeon]
MSKVVEFLRNIGLVQREVKQARRYVFEVSPERLREVVSGLIKVDENIYVSTISAVDYISEGFIEVNYCLWGINDAVMVVLKVKAPRDSPKVPTIHDLIPGALNSELDTYDLVGVVFEGNDKLRRGFLVPSEVVSQGIYPLRKDFKV